MFELWRNRKIVLYIVGGGFFGANDLPYMKRPEDKKIRMPVGSWFRSR
jgi:hypothetical protein